MNAREAAILLGLSVVLTGCALGLGGNSLPPGEALTVPERLRAIRRAEVWSRTDIPSLDLKAGPDAKGGFQAATWTTCEYKEKKLSGHSPKFACETEPGHSVKVKYGPRNGEVFGEVLSTRLFWALGFPADRMYPVRVRCRGCPKDPWVGPEKSGDTVDFDPAAIERKLPGRAMETRQDSGWKWSELELIGPEAGAGARAQRDALKLLAAFVQHTDSKAANQRLLCPKGEEVGKTGCRRPVLMVSDLGLTFARANFFNHNANSSVNFARWSSTPVWKDPVQCVAQHQGSFTGSLKNPRISEAGREFLAGLLVQLSDAQLHDLFETARVTRRPRDPGKDGPSASVDEWVAAFKRKRSEIVDHRCPN
jgi:hypothetical protein